MNATVEASYLGAKRVKVTHASSRALLMTEPEETFSPTDLIPAALGSCILTVLGTTAEKNGYALTAAEVAIEKRMYEEPRRIGELSAILHLPNRLSATARKLLEDAAKACPVRYSLHTDIALSFEFHYDLEPQESGEHSAALLGLPPMHERKDTAQGAPSLADTALPKPERREHWEHMYTTKAEAEVSWHQDEPTLSLELIREFAAPGSKVIDIGGGSSVLAGRLLEQGFACAVLDISEAALARAKERIGNNAAQIQWIVSDVTAAPGLGTFDLWHDRAVFHFLIDPEDRKRYVAHAEGTVPIGGHVIIGTFALDGPEKCSGLPIERYDGKKLAAELGQGFAVRRELHETHTTPWGTTQRFTYAVFERVPHQN